MPFVLKLNSLYLKLSKLYSNEWNLYIRGPVLQSKCLDISDGLMKDWGTRAVAVVIFVPPAAPTTILTRPAASTTMAGHIDDSGRFPP